MNKAKNEAKNRADILSREPWPANGIEHYKTIDDGPWGYLIVYADGRFEFDNQLIPAREEILGRWSFYFSCEPATGK